MLRKNIILFISLAIVLALNLYFRSFPINFPQLKIHAAKIVNENIQRMAINDVQARFGQFYPTAKDAILKSRISEYKRANKDSARTQIKEVYNKLKDRFQDETGQTYLMELDCWHWGRYVNNVVKWGHPGDEIIGGKEWDRMMLAPLGMFMHWEKALFYYAAYPYKLFNIIKPMPLFKFLFYFPLVIAGIFILVLFFFTYSQSGYLGGLISSIFIGVSPVFLVRSCAGWFDKDIFTLLFPLLIIWAYVTGRTNRSFKHSMIWVFISSLLVGLFCATWIYWWYIFVILLAYEFFAIIFNVVSIFFLKQDKTLQLKRHVLFLSCFIFFSLVWVLIFSGTQPLEMFYRQVIVAIVLNKPLVTSIWPNVFYTVGELRRMDMADMVGATGGQWVSIPSFLCMIALLIRSIFGHSQSATRRAYIVILFLWFVSMAFASSRGVRFAVFLLIPLGISLGWVINDLYEHFKTKRNVPAICCVILLAAGLSFMPIKNGYRAASGIYPLMDDTWYSVLNKIKSETSLDAIINSWWDFGDWFKAAAGRRVIFDGQTQDKPQAYWMAKAMLISDEEKSIAILRMLNNGGNKAFELIDQRLNDPIFSVLLLENVLGLQPDRAKNILLKFLPAFTVDDVMNILYAIPSKAGFVVDYSMLPKMPAISYLGNWDFAKVYIAQNFDKMESDRIMDRLKGLGKDVQEAHRHYQEVFLISTKKLDDWLSQRLQFYSPLTNGREKDGSVYFDNGFVYNIKDSTLGSNTGHVPRSLFVAEENGEINETVYSAPNVGFSILIYKIDSGYKSILLDRQLGPSVFARIYFLRGRSLRHFMPRIDAEDGNSFIRYLDIIW